MFLIAFLTIFPLLAVSVREKTFVVRQSSVSLPISRRVSNTGIRDLVQRDRRRARHLVSVSEAKESGTSIPDPVDVTNTGLGYVAEVGVGSPVTNYTLLIDTGSANTWVGAIKPYVKTITSVKTGQHVNVTYETGSIFGEEFLDTVTLGSGLVICRQSIGAAINTTDFVDFGLDGILGLGPAPFTSGTLSPDKDAVIPTVTDNLFSQRVIQADLVAISFEPTTKPNETNGEVLFGATDRTKFTGEITYIPRSSASLSKFFWSIDQSISYGNQPILSTTHGIVDTGTSLILIATEAFQRYQSATGAIMDNVTGLLTITNAQYGNLESLFFTAGHRKFEFVSNAQIWPRALNTVIGGNSTSIYLIVADLDINTVEKAKGLEFVNGVPFLERFYSVYDTKTGRVGLATTPHTKDTIN